MLLMDPQLPRGLCPEMYQVMIRTVEVKSKGNTYVSPVARLVLLLETCDYSLKSNVLFEGVAVKFQVCLSVPGSSCGGDTVSQL